MVVKTYEGIVEFYLHNSKSNSNDMWLPWPHFLFIQDVIEPNKFAKRVREFEYIKEKFCPVNSPVKRNCLPTVQVGRIRIKSPVWFVTPIRVSESDVVDRLIAEHENVLNQIDPQEIFSSHTSYCRVLPNEVIHNAFYSRDQVTHLIHRLTEFVLGIGDLVEEEDFELEPILVYGSVTASILQLYLANRLFYKREWDVPNKIRGVFVYAALICLWGGRDRWYLDEFLRKIGTKVKDLPNLSPSDLFNVYKETVDFIEYCPHPPRDKILRLLTYAEWRGKRRSSSALTDTNVEQLENANNNVS